MRVANPLGILASVALVLAAACAPFRSAETRSNPYDSVALPCDGEEVLRVQNSLTASVEIVSLALERHVHTGEPVGIALLSPGAHTLKVPAESDRYYAARTAGSSEYLSTTLVGKQLQNPSVRLEVQCRARA